MKHIPWLLVLVGLGSLGAAPAQAQTGCLMDDVLRCWHVTGVYGETPKRVVNIMRHLGDRHAPADVIRRVELVQAIEDAGSDQRYVICKVQMDILPAGPAEAGCDLMGFQAAFCAGACPRRMCKVMDIVSN